MQPRFELTADSRAGVDGRFGLGVFDSGLGGLAVVARLLDLGLPYDLAYVADQCHAPYGDRDLAEIAAFTTGVADCFIAAGIRVIVLACNSASAAALYHLRERYPDTRFVGMEPAVKPAVTQTRTGVIGILATAATLKGEPYRRVAARYGTGCRLVERASPDLVDLVERGLTEGPLARQVVEQAVDGLRAAGADTIVLGCTHFSFLARLIATVAGPDIQVIDPSEAVARQALRVAQAESVPTVPSLRHPRRRFITTGDPGSFATAVARLPAILGVVSTARWQAANPNTLH